VRKADNLPPSCAVVTKSGNLNFLEPSGPVYARNGADLPFTFQILVTASRIRVVVGGGVVPDAVFWHAALKSLVSRRGIPSCSLLLQICAFSLFC